MVATDSEWCIVLGEGASRADVVAAKRVSEFLKGLGVKTKIRRVGGAPYPKGNTVAIGTVVTNPWLRELADRGCIEVASASPGRKGFVIKCLEERGREVLALAGADRLGVLYATDELFGRVRRLEDLKPLPSRTPPGN